ncbi:MAG: N-6 DNA methylase [Nitrospirae bacterium]|nr:N-6 DNA methylase [Nitrospirota bacterium]
MTESNIIKNIFCNRNNLHTEADVESLFIDRLIAKLRYPDNKVRRKNSLESFQVGKGSKKELYRPDYVLLNKEKKPIIVIDAKSPTENPNSYLYQVSGYALALNQKYAGENPVQFTVLSNGIITFIYQWDEEKPILKLSFADFEEDNNTFVRLRGLLSYGAFDILKRTSAVFVFERPPLDEVIRAFDSCHQTIWKKEKKGPTDAFFEFAKIMFVKLREDHRISRMIVQKKELVPADFNFSVAWIQEQVKNEIDENPVKNILFPKIRDLLEEQIRKGEKKRIFQTDETLNLGLSTIIEVVRNLEHMNLHGIDEDLNGRMFETFLNATVRGKELGQFFTPRSIVKYMTHCADLTATRSFLPKVIDGCCGSGGFLIEAMAVLVHQIDGMTHLSDKERDKLKHQLFHQHLWGVDANESITRIARLNMYLHGDGGSKIFTADFLDKTLTPDRGWEPERQNEYEELRSYMLDNEMLFDVVLTNPPFSMSYKSSDPHASRVLSQYDIAKTKSGKPANSAKSNILFLERFGDLLKSGGELITVIDNSVLNGDDSQEIRNFILERFIIIQVVALPFNTFFRAQANVQTSILHLKRKESGEAQCDIFMAILNNIGHDDHQRSTPNRDNIPRLQELFLNWKTMGKLEIVIEPNAVTDETLGCPFQVFVLPSKDLSPKRLDAFYYAPELKQLRNRLKSLELSGTVEILKGSDFTIIPSIRAAEYQELLSTGERLRYFEIGDVTQDGAITTHDVGTIDELPTRARLRVNTNDVVFAKNNSSRGTTVIIPDEFNGQVVTTGFIGIRPRDREDALLLWSVLVSEVIRKQIYYLAITAVQPEIREEIFRNEFLIPIPKDEEKRKQLVENANQVITLQNKVRLKVREGRAMTSNVFGEDYL